MPYSIANLISTIRFIVGIILTLIALRAFLRSRDSSMFYLTAGFALLTVGDLFSAIYFIDDKRMDKLLSDIFDILGLVALIVAVKKS